VTRAFRNPRYDAVRVAGPDRIRFFGMGKFRSACRKACLLEVLLNRYFVFVAFTSMKGIQLVPSIETSYFSV